MSENNPEDKNSLFTGGLGDLLGSADSDSSGESRETDVSETPASAEPVTDQPAQAEQESSGVPRILIAEDEKAISNVLSIKLKNSGFEVDVANNGEEAIDLLSKNIYDVVLLDLIMPKVNGFEVLKSIKDSGKSVNVLVSSNLSQKEDIEKAKALGAKDYYVKSDITLSEIVDKVNKYK